MGFMDIWRWAGQATLWDTLASNLEAGLPPDRALDLAAAPCGGVVGRRARLAAQRVATGTPMHQALAEAGEDAIACAILRAGETSGRIPPLARQLAEGYRLRVRLRDEALSRLAYPTLLVHVALVVPAVPGVFAGTTPPWMLLLGPGLLWLLLGLAVGTAWMSHSAGVLSALVLRWPLSALCRPALEADLAAVLRAAIGAGMLLPDALELAAGGCANRLLAQRLHTAATELRSGLLPDLHAAMGSIDLSRNLLEMVRTGEMSGRLEQTLEQIRVIASERFAWRLQWTARVTCGIAYGIAILVAVAVIFSMYAGYINMFNSVAKDLESN